LLKPHGLVADYRFRRHLDHDNRGRCKLDRPHRKQPLVRFAANGTTELEGDRLEAALRKPTHIDFLNVPASDAAEFIAINLGFAGRR
jgi:hypothetical protein